MLAMQDHSTHKQEPRREKKKTTTTKTRMKGVGGASVVAVVVVAGCLLAAAAVVDGAVTCGDVDASLLPCVAYLTGKEAAPSAACCAGVKRLRTLPVGTAERRFACDCVKKAAARFKGLNGDAIRDLPANCGSPLPFPLTLDFDCSTIP
ncbi:non-specific lipid-transfer protein A-like [Oryza brachyantha]|uniref:non-specific lipid-transfer protein A-like n=1 Tax=Oryza brachyantha TaxID=4533 RepID=UPI001ADBB3FB|nr:non-specific lipid-transfer protein A-like [Oryza brachyantha]